MKKLLIDCLCHNYSEGELVKRFINEYSGQITPENAISLLIKTTSNTDISNKLLKIAMKDKAKFNDYITKYNCRYFNKMTISSKELVLNKIDDIDVFKKILSGFYSIKTQYQKINLLDQNKVKIMEDFCLCLTIKDKLQK